MPSTFLSQCINIFGIKWDEENLSPVVEIICQSRNSRTTKPKAKAQKK